MANERSLPGHTSPASGSGRSGGSHLLSLLALGTGAAWCWFAVCVCSRPDFLKAEEEKIEGVE